MKDELERVEIPGEAEARDRAWAMVESAFEERPPSPRPLALAARGRRRAGARGRRSPPRSPRRGRP